jgi:hypothetical protein
MSNDKDKAKDTSQQHKGMSTFLPMPSWSVLLFFILTTRPSAVSTTSSTSKSLA